MDEVQTHSTKFRGTLSQQLEMSESNSSGTAKKLVELTVGLLELIELIPGNKVPGIVRGNGANGLKELDHQLSCREPVWVKQEVGSTKLCSKLTSPKKDYSWCVHQALILNPLY